MKDCLEARREEVGFSAECKEELEAMMEKRAADFRLDSTLREARSPHPAILPFCHGRTSTSYVCWLP